MPMTPRSARARRSVETEPSAAPDEQLHRGVLRWHSVLMLSLAGVAPLTMLFFIVPTLVTDMGEAAPLILLSLTVGLLFFGVVIASFARHVASAGGVMPWIEQGLGPHIAFVAGWLMLGAYALLTVAAEVLFGSLTTLGLATFWHVQIAGGWVFWSIVNVVAVYMLAYGDLRWSLLVLMPVALLEVGIVLLFNGAIALQSRGMTVDVIHIFTHITGGVPGPTVSAWAGFGMGAFVGCEVAVVYGEEVRHPHRAIPVVIFLVVGCIAGLSLWTTSTLLAETSWQHAVRMLDEPSRVLALASYVATRSVGTSLRGWLVMLASVSAFASSVAFHHGTLRYLYTLGRKRWLPDWLAITHPRWKTPVFANLVQMVFALVLIACLGFVMQHQQANGQISYTLGIADGVHTLQTSGLISSRWLAAVGTLAILLVCVLTTLAALYSFGSSAPCVLNDCGPGS